MFFSPRHKQYFWIVLLPLSVAWAAATWVRRRFARRGYRSSLKVVCVGNLHSGGSGKTPIVSGIAQHLRQTNPGILSRGYRASLSRVGARVDLSNGGPSLYGDEPWMLAQTPSCPVYIGANRAKMARQMEAEKRCDWILMDDGFQHFGIEKDISLVVFNAEKSLETLFCLPFGDLREPVGALRAASAVLVSYEREEDCEPWLELLQTIVPRTPVYPARRVYSGVKTPAGETCASLPRLGAFCGLGDPTSFERYVRESLGVKFVETFADHHRYRSEDWDRLQSLCRAHDAEALLCTEKDAHKIKDLSGTASGVYTVGLHYEFPDEFWYFLKNVST